MALASLVLPSLSTGGYVEKYQSISYTNFFKNGYRATTLIIVVIFKKKGSARISTILKEYGVIAK